VGSDFVQIVDGYCSATVELAHLEELKKHAGVSEVEANRFLKPQLNQSLRAIHAREAAPEHRPQQSATTERGRDKVAHERGAGVVIGIVDYGIDFTLDDFREANKSSKTRIAFLWDQQINPEVPGEKSPTKYRYGIEYSADDINRALSSRGDPFTVVRHKAVDDDTDVSGHGTHVAGIAAGNGRTGDTQFPADNYIGVAPEATIIFVHLNRKAIVKHVAGEGTLSNSVNLAHAIAYCFEKAEELKKPCVVNLSMGFNGGGHDGNTAVEWIIDALLQKSGRAVVAAAGNEDEHRAHYGGCLKQGGRALISWKHGRFVPGRTGPTFYPDPSANEVEIWYSRNNKLRARLISPDGQSSPPVDPGECAKPFRFAGGESVQIVSDQRTPWRGDARISVILDKGSRTIGIRYGTWKIELEAVEVAAEDPEKELRFDAWIERTMPMDAPTYWRSRFADQPDEPPITITTPATAHRVIAVANYALGPSGEWIAEASGRGPTRDKREKPELAAPGQGIYSSAAGASRRDRPAAARRQMQGTSMSAPHVTGVVARLLSRQNYLMWDEILDILIHSADAVSPDGRWDRKWGHGKLNAAKAMRLLEERLLAR
jgi:subtilisin family serine protease